MAIYQLEIAALQAGTFTLLGTTEERIRSHINILIARGHDDFRLQIQGE